MIESMPLKAIPYFKSARVRISPQRQPSGVDRERLARDSCFPARHQKVIQSWDSLQIQDNIAFSRQDSSDGELRSSRLRSDGATHEATVAVEPSTGFHRQLKISYDAQ
jgi:hypothetical protein